MELHLGKLVDSVRKSVGMTEAELARRAQYTPNNVNKFKSREHFYTDALDTLCIVLRHNFYEDKAREIAAKLNPGSVAEPVVPYEKDNMRTALVKANEALALCKAELELNRDLVKSKDELISSKDEVINLLKSERKHLNGS